MPEPFGPMIPTRSPRVMVVDEVADDHALAPREAHVRASTTSRPERSASCACKLHRARALAPLPALDAQRLERAHASLVPRATRLDAGSNPDFLLRELLVELRPLARLGGERGLLAREVRVVVGAPIHETAAVELDDARRHAAQKGAIVRHEHAAWCAASMQEAARSTRWPRRRGGSSARRAAAHPARARARARAGSAACVPPDAAANGASASSPRCTSTVSTRVCICHAPAASSA